MYVCMSGWMCMGRGELLVSTSFAMVFLMHIYALQEFSHHGQTCEGQPIRQKDADGAQGSPTCSQFIARKKLLPVRPLARFEMKEQVRSATRPASLHIHLLISSDVYEPYKVLHTYKHTYIHTYIHTVHIVHSLHLTIFEIRRELAVGQQQMDDTVGGDGI